MRVLIIGGGIGGLALANGLKRRKIEVAVFERDTDLTATGGYHIHLDAVAISALSELLEPQVLEHMLASSATGRLQGGDVVRDMRGRLLNQTREPNDAVGVNIDRISLRLLLASGLGDVLSRGRVFSEYVRRGDGSVVARFDDGSEEVGDVLIGADGTHSRVARQLAGGPTSRPVGLLGIGGRTRVDALPAPVAALFAQRSGLAVGPYGTGLYIGYHDPIGQAAAVSADAPAPVTMAPTYIWGAVVSESPETDALRSLAGAELRDATAAFLRRKRWSDRMLAVITETETDGVDAFRLHAASADPTELAPWPASTVTVLGDGVHAMPPTAGMGAATAIQDAARLTTELTAACRREKTVTTATRDYENDMRGYAAAAIAASMRPVGWIHGTNTPFGALVARAALPALAGLAGLRRR